MATTVRRLTYDDLESIPQEQAGDRHELIEGELVVTPAPVPYHQIVSRALFRALDQHVVERQLGLVLFAPVDVRLTATIVLIPDIIYVAQDRLHIIGPKTVDAAPDIVVEILSPGTRRRDLEVKRELYARFGVQEYWIADPDARSLMILALQGDQFAALDGDETGILSSRVLPGLTLKTADVFASIINR
jgi:Uma2 family endonuclease